MATRISNVLAIAACDAQVDHLDGGGKIEIRSGAQPVGGPDSAATGTILAVPTLSAPAFGAAVDGNPGGQATANPITDDSSADNTGIAGWFRAYDIGNVPVIDGSVTVTGGGGDMELNSVNIQAGTAVEITSWVYTQPEG